MRKCVGVIIGILLLLSCGSSTFVLADEVTTPEHVFEITDSAKKEVCLVGTKMAVQGTSLMLPETITYQGMEYTVTSINYNAEKYNYPNVTEIIIPASVTGDVVFNYPEDIYDLFHNLAFADLIQIKFLGNQPPARIKSMLVRTESDLFIHVPVGCEEAYAKIVEPTVFSYIYEIYLHDYDEYYKSIDIMPIIISDVTLQSEQEPNVFAMDNAIYRVTNKSIDGNGAVELIYLKTPVAVRELTIPTEAMYHDTYKYTVTSLAECSLQDVRADVLRIPDTITSMKKGAINLSHVKALFLSSNCTVIPSNLFLTGEENIEIALIHVPYGVKKIEKNAFAGCKATYIDLPDNVKVAKATLKNRADHIKYYNTNNITTAKQLKVENPIISIGNGESATIKIAATNKKSNEPIRFVSLDNSFVTVTAKGKVTTKCVGDGIVLAYSQVTGKLIRIEVRSKMKTFKQGIYRYSINPGKAKTVTIIKCKPDLETTTLEIPSSVKYKGVTYTVTDIFAGTYKIDPSYEYAYNGKDGYVRTWDYDKRLVNTAWSNKCNVEKIIIPSTVTGKVGSFANMNCLKTIEFRGKKAPTEVSFTEIEEVNVSLKVPTGSLKQYKNMKYIVRTSDVHATYNKWTKKSGIKLTPYR